MTTAEFLSTLRERGVRVWVEDGRLKADAPTGILDDALRGQLAARKQELMDFVSRDAGDAERPRSLVPLKSDRIATATVRPSRPQRGRLLL